MSSKALNQLRLQVTTLTEFERATLARELITSLDGQPDNSVKQAWNDEIA